MNQVKCYNANNIFFACFVSSQISDYPSQQVLFAQMISCAMRYDAIYHPLSILNNNYYLRTWRFDSPASVVA